MISIDDAFRLLDPDTSRYEIIHLEYYAGFDYESVIKRIEEACTLACNIMRERENSEENDNCISASAEDKK